MHLRVIIQDIFFFIIDFLWFNVIIVIAIGLFKELRFFIKDLKHLNLILDKLELLDNTSHFFKPYKSKKKLWKSEFDKIDKYGI